MSASDAAPGAGLRRLFLVACGLAFVAHALACAAMVTVLAPGVDLHAAAAARAAHVAGHAGAWRLGWLPWHACAASNVAVSALLVVLASKQGGRRGLGAALAALLVTLVAVVPDQWGELVYDTSFVDLAREAVRDPGALVPYVRLEARVLLLTGTCATAAYTGMFVAWLAAAALLAGTGKLRALLLASGALATVVFAAAAWANVAPCRAASVEGGYPGFDLVVALNTAGFALLVPWYALLGFVLSRQPGAAPVESV